MQPRQKKATVRLVASHMAHAADTAKRFYQHLQGEKESVTVFNKISSSKRQAEETEELVQPWQKEARKKWLKEEAEVLITHFNLGVNGTTPSADECQAFLGLANAPLFIGRTKKEVQDKCRTILRNIK